MPSLKPTTLINSPHLPHPPLFLRGTGRWLAPPCLLSNFRPTKNTCQSQRCPNMEFSIGVEVRKKLRIGNFFFPPFFLWFWPPRAHITQKSQIYRLILHIKCEKYRSDLALTLSLYLYGGLFLILHIKYWSTYLYGRNLCLTPPYYTWHIYVM